MRCSIHCPPILAQINSQSARGSQRTSSHVVVEQHAAGRGGRGHHQQQHRRHRAGDRHSRRRRHPPRSPSCRHPHPARPHPARRSYPRLPHRQRSSSEPCFRRRGAGWAHLDPGRLGTHEGAGPPHSSLPALTARVQPSCRGVGGRRRGEAGRGVAEPGELCLVRDRWRGPPCRANVAVQ